MLFRCGALVLTALVRKHCTAQKMTTKGAIVLSRFVGKKWAVVWGGGEENEDNNGEFCVCVCVCV